MFRELNLYYISLNGMPKLAIPKLKAKYKRILKGIRGTKNAYKSQIHLMAYEN